MSALNWWAIVAAALSAFALGGLWYGPLFKQAWCREAGIDPASAPDHPARVFATAFLASLVAAAAFAWWLGPRPGLLRAVHDGLLVGLAIVGMAFAVNYAFARRSLKLWLVDAGYHMLQFMLYGLILGAWH